MRADWTASGACTSGSTAPPRGATKRASGGAATTSTTRAERSRGGRGATAGLELSRRMASERSSQQAFLGVSALLFAASAAVTIGWCASMLEKLSEADWTKVTEAEKWSVGVTAHHL